MYGQVTDGFLLAEGQQEKKHETRRRRRIRWAAKLSAGHRARSRNKLNLARRKPRCRVVALTGRLGNRLDKREKGDESLKL